MASHHSLIRHSWLRLVILWDVSTVQKRLAGPISQVWIHNIQFYHPCSSSIYPYFIFFNSAPENIAAPKMNALNESTLEISWSPPTSLNGPEPYYIIRRAEASFNFPPPAVEAGTRFAGTGYYKFPPDTIPQGVSFTGQFHYQWPLLNSHFWE